MQIGYIEKPQQGVYEVQLDGITLDAGHFAINPRNQRYTITMRDGKIKRQLRTEPHSREGAACLLLFHHFEAERKMLKEAADADSSMP